MSKNRISVKALTAGAMMAALSIVFERVLAVMPASNMMDIRITLSNVPIILCGTLISPLMGALCGVVSDVVGCFISGYAPFPLLTLAPLVMGVLPGLLLGKKKVFGFWKIVFAIILTHALSSALITTYGLSVMRGVPFVPLLITRLPSMGINLVLDEVLVCLILKSDLSKEL